MAQCDPGPHSGPRQLAKSSRNLFLYRVLTPNDSSLAELEQWLPLPSSAPSSERHRPSSGPSPVAIFRHFWAKIAGKRLVPAA
jgi:hypothetical protein